MKLIRRMLLITAVVVITKAQADPPTNSDDLFAMDLEQLLTVTVESPSKFKQLAAEAPAAISVIKRQDIELFGANSLLEVLDRATSIVMSGSFFFPQNVASMRGDYQSHSDNHMLLMLNGRPMRESFTGGENFSIYNAFPLDLIKQIEIIRGPGSVLYGSSAYSGVINIVTLSAAEIQPKLSLMAGSFAAKALKATTGYQDENLSLATGIHYFSEQGWRFNAIDNNSQAGGFDAGEDNYALVTIGHYKDLSINASITRSRQDFWGSTSTWSGAVAQSDRDISSRRFLLDLGYQFDLAKGQYLDANLSYADAHFSHYNYDSQSKNIFAEATYHHEWSDNLRLLGGATGWHQNVASRAGISNAPVPEFSQTWWTAYGQLNYQVTTNLDWMVGAQINKVPDVTANTVPRVGIIYKLSDRSGLKFNHGQAFRAAYGVETNFNLVICCKDDGSNRGGLRGNPSLKPETVTTSDIQYYHWGNSFQFNGTLFYSKQEDLIERTRASDNVLDFINRGTLDSKGLELEYRYALSSRSQITAAYTYQTNETTIAATGVQVEDITLQPNHMLKLGISTEFDNGATLGVFDTYFSHGHDNIKWDPNRKLVNPPADSYHLVSANLRLPLTLFSPSMSQHSAIVIYGYNLLDEAIYQPELAGRAINTNPLRAGRSVYVSLDWAF